MIKKVEGGYKVFAESGRPMSKILPTKLAAKKRLAQIEYFKHAKGGK